MTRQSAISPVHLAARAIIEVTGSEARAFLHSLVTNDVAALREGQAQWAGLLTPQGKILFDFFILARPGETFWLDVSAAAAEDLTRRMGLYRLRRDVRITPRPDLAVAAGGVDGAVAAFADPRLPAFGTRAVLTAQDAARLDADASAHHAARIAAGLPDSDADIGSGRLFPHEANFDQLNGVSFTKGCYIGQEVVSRMHHKGLARNRLVPVIADAPLKTGARIMAGEKPLGEIFSTADKRAIALVRLDRAASAIEAGIPLLADGVPVRLVRPSWAGFDVPGA